MNFITAINTIVRIHILFFLKNLICERFQFTGILSQMLQFDWLPCLLFTFMTGNESSGWPASMSFLKK